MGAEKDNGSGCCRAICGEKKLCNWVLQLFQRMIASHLSDVLAARGGREGGVTYILDTEQMTWIILVDLVAYSFQPAHLSLPLEESFKRQKQSLVLWSTLKLDRIGLSLLMFELILHLKLIFSIQLELSKWFSEIMHGEMLYRF